MSKYPFDFVHYEVDRSEKIATVTFSNPSKKNAAPFWAEFQLVEAIDQWEYDDDVKVVILRGEGGNFCAGHDVGGYLDAFHISEKPDEPRRRPSNRDQLYYQRNHRMAQQRLFYSFKPTIAEISGMCVEWGNQMQACCDMSIAAEDAHIGNLGQAMGVGGITLIRLHAMLIGYKRMREMMMCGRTLSGRDAAMIGLVNRAVPAAKLHEEVLNDARRIALLPIDGIITGKAYTQMIYDSMGLGKAFTETYYGHMPSLKVRYERGDFWFLDELRRHGPSEAIRKRKERYEKLGGFGAAGELSIFPADS